ncbi:MAG: HD domain-containing protein [Candidatus Paceibacterota bacterium]
MMNKKQAITFLKEKVETDNLRKHSLAVGAAMRSLAEHFDKDPDSWEVCGLLHDIDYEETKDEPSKHSELGREILLEKGLSEKICDAVYTHNSAHEADPKSLMGKSLYCVDSLTGLIVAATLVLPSNKIEDLEVENVINRFEEERFAAGADREAIAKSEDYLGLELEEFIEITLDAMKGISDELGL